MPTPYTYIIQSDLEAFRGSALNAVEVAQFKLFLPAMMEMVDQYTNRTWNFSNPVVETFDALSSIGPGVQSNYQFFVSSPNISKTPANNLYPNAGGVISVQIGGSYLDLNYVASYNSYVKLAASFPSVILANPLGFKMVKITYNSDSVQNCPAPVKLAICQWIARVMQTSGDSGKEVNKVQTGTVIAQYNFSQ
jgi:hypothetical protein